MSAILRTVLGRLEETALIKDEENYTWYKYTGKPVSVGTKRICDLEQGDVFGLRPSASGKDVRLIAEKYGVTKVFTVDQADVKMLSKRSSPVKRR